MAKMQSLQVPLGKHLPIRSFHCYTAQVPLCRISPNGAKSSFCALSSLHDFSLNYPVLTSDFRGIGLETCILFAREGANVVMADISAPALEKASDKLKQLVPSHHKVETFVRPRDHVRSNYTNCYRSAMCQRSQPLRKW